MEPETTDALKKLAVRCLFAVPLAGATFYLWSTAQGGFSAAPMLILSSALLILAGVILASPLAELFSQSAGNLFFPANRNTQPSPMYSIGEAKIRQGRYHEALEYYQQIAKDYPAEVEPHIQLMNLAFTYLGDRELGDSFYRAGLDQMKSERTKAMLTRMYEGLRTQVDQAAQKWGDRPESC